MSKYSKTWLFAKRSWANTLFILGITSILLTGLPIYGLRVQKAEADLSAESQNKGKPAQTSIITLQENTVVPTLNHPYNLQIEAIKTIEVIVTGYSSTPEETDDTPYITASGKTVKDGTIANNLLPFGTKIKIPEIYGDKVFVVEDRMNKRFESHHIDIWFASSDQALSFGVKRTYLELY